MKRESSEADHFSLVMGLVGILTFFFMWKANRDLVNRMIMNESYVDILSASFWLTASIICIYRIKINSNTHNFLLYFWAIFSFLCCAEELKWGYRIFHYTIPALQEINFQNDISLHNLKLCAKWPLGPQKLFSLGFFTYFFVLPLLTSLKKTKSYFQVLKDKLNYTTPGFFFLSATWVNILISYLIPYVFTTITSSSDHRIMTIMCEAREMFFSFVVLSYVYFYLPADNLHFRSNNYSAVSRLLTLEHQPPDLALDDQRSKKNQ